VDLKKYSGSFCQRFQPSLTANSNGRVIDELWRELSKLEFEQASTERQEGRKGVLRRVGSKFKQRLVAPRGSTSAKDFPKIQEVSRNPKRDLTEILWARNINRNSKTDLN